MFSVVLLLFFTLPSEPFPRFKFDKYSAPFNSAKLAGENSPSPFQEAFTVGSSGLGGETTGGSPFLKTLHSTPGSAPCHPLATPPSLARDHTRSPHPGEERPRQHDSVRYSFVLYPEGHFSPSSEGSRHFLKQKIQEDNFHPWFLGWILPGLPREGRKRAGCVQGESRNFQGQAGERVLEGRARWCRREPQHASQI